MAMMYLGKTLALPCSLCKESCKAIPAACRESCKGVGKLCGAFRDLWAPITQNPLGGYVLGSWLVMLLVIAAFAVSFPQVQCDTGDAEDNPKALREMRLYIAINIALAVVHIVGARYLQWRIVSGIKKDQGEDAIAEMSHEEISSKANHIALYDFGFCLYFFIFCIAFIFSCYGITYFGECEGTGPAWSAAAVKILYGIVVVSYFLFWYSCQALCKARERVREKRSARQEREAEQIGASAGGRGSP